MVLAIRQYGKSVNNDHLADTGARRSDSDIPTFVHTTTPGQSSRMR
jgi:hypothetical protein